MLLADKIISLRKKCGWSQEELAEQLNVSRQAVSKWESASSIPDIDKIIKMSELFGVSTDYLLKETDVETEINTTSTATDYGDLIRVSLEDASNYIDKRYNASNKIAFGTLLCIISFVPLLILAALSEMPESAITENFAAAIGLTVMLVLIAWAISIFIRVGSTSKGYEFLETDVFETEYGVIEMVNDRKHKLEKAYTTHNIIATILCILSVIPVFICACLEAADLIVALSATFMFVAIAIGVYLFISTGVKHAALSKLLQENDYSKEHKTGFHIKGTVSTAYWLLITAVFLYVTFTKTMTNQESWIIWAIGGVVFPAVLAIVNAIEKNKNKKS